MRFRMTPNRSRRSRRSFIELMRHTANISRLGADETRHSLRHGRQPAVVLHEIGKDADVAMMGRPRWV